MVVEITLGIIGFILFCFFWNVFCLENTNSTDKCMRIKPRLDDVTISCIAKNIITDKFESIFLIYVVVSLIYILKKYNKNYDSIYDGVYFSLIFIALFSYVIIPILIKVKIYKVRHNVKKVYK